MTSAGPSIDFIVKISKFCNLRCTYCYEYDELGNKRRMSLEQLRAFFEHIAATAAAHGRVRFIWHGGEPLLIPLQVYENIGRLQREVFPPTLTVVNLVQTNLTVLTDAQLEFLRDKRFFSEGLGVSFDVYGDQRIDIRGRLRTETVLANLQRLQDAGIRFGAITVLARNTLPKIVPIFRFFETLGVGFRLLPIYKSANAVQLDAHALSFAEITGALKAVFDAWWVSERATPVQPLGEYLRYASAVVGGAPKTLHDPASGERSFIVDTDGSAYGQANSYEPGYAYGNVFGQDFGELLASAARQRAVDESRRRLDRHCASCPYHGHCPGGFVAEASAEQRRALDHDGCQVRELIGHIVHRLAAVPRPLPQAAEAAAA